MLEKVNCDICSKEFYKKSSEIKRTKNNYCSYICSNIGKTKDKNKICQNCQKVFWAIDIRSKFCSHSCAASFNNKGKIRNGKSYKKVPCLNCGNIFNQKRHKEDFCSRNCFVDFQRKEKIKRFLNSELNDKQVRTKLIREYLIKKQNGVCTICKHPPLHNKKPLVFIVDHIDGVFTNNNPENVRAICPNCNSQTDTFSGKNAKKNKEKRHKKNGRP
jgi:hypothetical protein